MVSGLRFRSLIHFGFIFVYGVRECSNSAVPNLFGTRDWFRGSQFFHGWGRGQRHGGSGSHARDGEWHMKLCSLAHRSPPAVWPGF